MTTGAEHDTKTSDFGYKCYPPKICGYVTVEVILLKKKFFKRGQWFRKKINIAFGPSGMVVLTQFILFCYFCCVIIASVKYCNHICKVKFIEVV